MLPNMTVNQLIETLELHRDAHGRGEVPVMVTLVGQRGDHKIGFVAGAGPDDAFFVQIMAV